MIADLVDFLLARIAEDETGLRDGADIEDDRWTTARMLADCQARRAMLGAASKAIYDFYLIRNGQLTRDPVDRATLLAGTEARRSAWVQAVQLLGMSYVDHADYRDEWRTTTDIAIWSTAGEA